MESILLRALCQTIKASTDPVEVLLCETESDIKDLREGITKVAPKLGLIDPVWENQLLDLSSHLEISLQTLEEATLNYRPFKNNKKVLTHFNNFKDLERCSLTILRCSEVLESSIPTANQIIQNSLDSIDGIWAPIRTWANKLNALVDG